MSSRNFILIKVTAPFLKYTAVNCDQINGPELIKICLLNLLPRTVQNLPTNFLFTRIYILVPCHCHSHSLLSTHFGFIHKQTITPQLTNATNLGYQIYRSLLIRSGFPVTKICVGWIKLHIHFECLLIYSFFHVILEIGVEKMVIYEPITPGQV